jgi:hypothetical protein
MRDLMSKRACRRGRDSVASEEGQVGVEVERLLKFGQFEGWAGPGSVREAMRREMPVRCVGGGGAGDRGQGGSAVG